MNKYIVMVSLVIAGLGMSLLYGDTVKMTKNPLYTGGYYYKNPLYTPLTQGGKSIVSPAYSGSLRYEAPRGTYARETYVQPGKRYAAPQITPVSQPQWGYGVEVKGAPLVPQVAYNMIVEQAGMPTGVREMELRVLAGLILRDAANTVRLTVGDIVRPEISKIIEKNIQRSRLLAGLKVQPGLIDTPYNLVTKAYQYATQKYYNYLKSTQAQLNYINSQPASKRKQLLNNLLDNRLSTLQQVYTQMYNKLSFYDKKLFPAQLTRKTVTVSQSPRWKFWK